MQKRTLALVASALVGLAACSSGGGTPAVATSAAPTTATPGPAGTPGYPDSIFVLGHSGATGYYSDPNNRERDATANSWATGTNPDVDSIYLRLLAKNPGIEGHNFTLAKDGSTVDDLLRQARNAVASDPVPELVMIETIDNDIRCDGTDDQNYGLFGSTLDEALGILQTGAPDAKIFFVSQWGTVDSYIAAIADHPAAVVANSGDGPCDAFDDVGAPRPEARSYLQDVVDRYFAEIVKRCAARTNCFTDDNAMATMAVVPEDVSPDYGHLSIQGHRDYAAIAWTAIVAAGLVPG